MTHAQQRLAGRIAVVTGGARGIGRFIAHQFAQEGARVAIADLDESRLAQAEAELRAIRGEALASRTDVRDEAAVSAFMARVAEQFGTIDLLVNNAAIVTHFNWGNPRWPRVRDMDKAFWDRVVDTNLGGAFLCTKHVLPYMEAHGGGHVLNVYAGGAFDNVGACAYGTAKGALRYFTGYVAEEERPHNVCVAAVAIDIVIATEEAPEDARQRLAGPEAIGDRYVQAALLGMESSGKLFTLKDGVLTLIS